MGQETFGMTPPSTAAAGFTPELIVVAEAAVAEATVTKAVDVADLDLFPHAKAVAHADAHAKAVAEAVTHYIAVAKTATLEKIKTEMRKHNGKT